MTPLERLFAVADDANGIGTKLDIRKWTFMNTDLVVHVHRVPDGEWIGIRAETSYGPDGIGTTFGTLFDESGAVGASSSRCWCRPHAASTAERRRPLSPAGEVRRRGTASRPAASGRGRTPGRSASWITHAAVVLHLEHVLGDRLADAVPGALAEVDFDPSCPLRSAHSHDGREAA